MTSSLPRRDNTRNSLDQRKRKRFLLAQKWERNVPTPWREPWKDWGCATTVVFFVSFFSSWCLMDTLSSLLFCFFNYTSDSKYLTNLWKQSKKYKELRWKALWDCRPSCRWWDVRRAWLERTAWTKAWAPRRSPQAQLHIQASTWYKNPLRRRAKYLHFLNRTYYKGKGLVINK